MSISVGSNIVRDGLIFGFDMGSKLSWKGRPMTNAFANPTNLNTSSWSGGNNFAYDPTTKLLSLTSTSGGSWVLQDTSLTQSLFYTFSAEVKAASTNYAQISPSTGFGASTYVNFDISQGQIVGGTASSYAAIKDIGGGWYRISVTMQADGNVAGRMTLGPCAYGTTRLAYSGLPIGTGIYVRSCQMEQNNYASQHVDGTRSATQAILDNSGNDNSLTVTDLLYNPDTTFQFSPSQDSVIFGPTQPAETNPSLSVFALCNPAYVNANYGIWGYLDVNTNLNCHFETQPSSVWRVRIGALNNSSAYAATTGWQYVGFTYDGSTVRFYINGEQKATWTGSSGQIFGNLSGDFQSVGDSHYFTGSERTWNGQIEAFQRYDRALSADEVLNNFEALRGRHGL